MTRRALWVAGGSSWGGPPPPNGHGQGQGGYAYMGDDDHEMGEGEHGYGSGPSANPYDYDPSQQVHQGPASGYGMAQMPRQPGDYGQGEEISHQILAMLVGQSYTSVAVLFFILIFRALHNYELADQMENPFKAAGVKLGLSVLMFGNSVGFLGALTRRRGLKSVMKMTLSANALYEGLAFCASFMAILLHKTMYISRDEFMVMMFWNAMLMTMCAGYRKANWR